jgi:DNA-binding winged helix-turn-helix (wHTH) protein
MKPTSRPREHKNQFLIRTFLRQGYLLTSQSLDATTIADLVDAVSVKSSPSVLTSTGQALHQAQLYGLHWL